ncbi:MAG: type II toxin-antitoxin system VapC family toxin [Gaiellaceae bacterium]
MALIVLDASVVIAHLDPADALHEAATSVLLEYASDDLRLPASAYAESLVDPARKGRLDDARDAIAALQLQIVPIDRLLAGRAASLRARERRLRLPDALVLACGEHLTADAIVTADRRWRRFERVRLIS